MTVNELIDILQQYQQAEGQKQIKLICSQIHGAVINENFCIYNNGTDILIEFNLNHDVCSSGY